MTDISSGVCSYSTEAGQQEYIIFCVGLSWITQHAFMQWARAKDIQFKELRGRFEGQDEVSFIANAKHFLTIARSGWWSGQRSVLHLGKSNAMGKRPATLRIIPEQISYLDGLQGWTEQDIGMFQQCVTGVEDQDYTYDPTTGFYYVCIREKKRSLRKLSNIRKSDKEAYREYRIRNGSPAW